MSTFSAKASLIAMGTPDPYGLAGRPEAFIERPALQKPVSISILGETINTILATAGKTSSRADDSSPNIQ
jgi:hypothetical protein